MFMPNLQHLIIAARNCLASYKEKRSEFDGQRFLGSVRPATVNQQRIDDAQFIVNLGDWLFNNQANLTKQLKHKNFGNETAPFIKQALSGAFLLELMAVTNTYHSEESVYTSSALGKVIMDVYKIKKLSDIATNDQNTCLLALKKLLTETDAKDFKMHPSKKNEAIVAEIDEKLATLEKSKTPTI